MTERCSNCNAILLWGNGRLICPRPTCTAGHNPKPTLLDEDTA